MTHQTLSKSVVRTQEMMYTFPNGIRAFYSLISKNGNDPIFHLSSFKNKDDKSFTNYLIDTKKKDTLTIQRPFDEKACKDLRSSIKDWKDLENFSDFDNLYPSDVFCSGIHYSITNKLLTSRLSLHHIYIGLPDIYDSDKEAFNKFINWLEKNTNIIDKPIIDLVPYYNQNETNTRLMIDKGLVELPENLFYHFNRQGYFSLSHGLCSMFIEAQQ